MSNGVRNPLVMGYGRVIMVCFGCYNMLSNFRVPQSRVMGVRVWGLGGLGGLGGVWVSGLRA